MDTNNDLGTTYVRESGCGVRYIINLEDADEAQYEVELDREQLKRLAAVCQKLLNEGKASPPPAPVRVSPPFSQVFWWSVPPGGWR